MKIFLSIKSLANHDIGRLKFRRIVNMLRSLNQLFLLSKCTHQVYCLGMSSKVANQLQIRVIKRVTHIKYQINRLRIKISRNRCWRPLEARIENNQKAWLSIYRSWLNKTYETKLNSKKTKMKRLCHPLRILKWATAYAVKRMNLK